MAVLQIYKNEACTELWRSIPIIELTPSQIGWGQTPAGAITLGEKTYKYFDVSMYSATALQGIPQITAAPFMSRYTTIAQQQYYCKNGYSLELGVTESAMIMRNYKYGNGYLGFSDQTAGVSDSQIVDYWVIGFTDPQDGTRYIGFTRVLIPTGSPWPGYVGPTSCIEASFWETALRPPYDYGQGQDPDGGQGSGGGTFRRTGVDDTSPPAGLIPTSAAGRGLHAYVISATNYGDLQNYLWGDSSTTAKALWQKFQNKIHSPASCIVAVYALPADFMPTGGAAVNIRLAGITLPVTANSVQLDFADYEVTFDPIDKPFHNFADFSHVTCKMYVPYCGEIPIPVEAAYGRSIKCRYWVDQFNGNLVARVSCGDINIGELSSNVAYRIPIIGGDDGSLDRIGAALTGIAQVSAGNYSGALGSAAEMATAPYTAQIINADFSGSISACTFRRPYIEWTANETYYSDEFLRTRGVPARYAAPLSSFSGGYLECITKINSVDIPSATDAEREEIESILRGGLFA